MWIKLNFQKFLLISGIIIVDNVEKSVEISYLLIFYVNRVVDKGNIKPGETFSRLYFIPKLSPFFNQLVEL